MPQARKVLVTGSSELPEGHRSLALELGRRLMTETSAMLVTGGLKSKGPGMRPALDAVVAEAARKALGSTMEAVSQRIMTMLPEAGRDGPDFKRVEIGTVVRVPYADRRSRRYAMVVHSDAVVAIGGSDSTREVIDLAYIAGKPLIPIPSTGGAAMSAWQDYEPELRSRLNTSDSEIADLNDSEVLSQGVTACLGILRRVLLPRCFVAMPFIQRHPVPNAYETISNVVKSKGYQVVRVDQEKFSGSIVEEVWDAIHHCDLAVVDLTAHRPNVYYEMGIAHALGKPTLLLVHSEDGNVPDDIPFDIRVQRILPYGTAQSLAAHLDTQVPTAGEILQTPRGKLPRR